MIVVSLGIINSTGNPDDPGLALFALIIAVLVNVTWGLIDGISVMYTSVLLRAESQEMVYALRAKRGDLSMRERAMASFDGVIVEGFGTDVRGKVNAMIQAGVPAEDPSKKRFRTTRTDRNIAYALVLIEVTTLLPMLTPLLVVTPVRLAISISYVISATIFAVLGATYARCLHRNRAIAAVLLAGPLFVVGLFTFYLGW